VRDVPHPVCELPQPKSLIYTGAAAPWGTWGVTERRRGRAREQAAVLALLRHPAEGPRFEPRALGGIVDEGSGGDQAGCPRAEALPVDQREQRSQAGRALDIRKQPLHRSRVAGRLKLAAEKLHPALT